MIMDGAIVLMLKVQDRAHSISLGIEVLRRIVAIVALIMITMIESQESNSTTQAMVEMAGVNLTQMTEVGTQEMAMDGVTPNLKEATLISQKAVEMTGIAQVTKMDGVTQIKILTAGMVQKIIAMVPSQNTTKKRKIKMTST